MSYEVTDHVTGNFFLSLVQDSLNLKYKYFLIFKEAQYE